MTGKSIPMRFCFNCGAELSRYREYDPLDDCGRLECTREAQNAIADQRYEVRRRADDDMGW